jgi:phosphatidylglycerophosphate synthase
MSGYNGSPGVPAETPERDRFATRAQSASLLLALILLAALALSLTLGRLEPLSLAGPLGLSALLLSLRRDGPCVSVLPNLITALRVALTGALGLAVLGPAPLPYALTVLAIFTLDGVDGTLARRLSASSPLGAHFDMESDGYLVLMLCALLNQRGLGSWVLLGGLLRYVYVITTGVFASRGEAPPSRFGRYAFSISLTALTLALLPQIELGRALALFGTAVLGGSFGRSFYWAFAART